MKSTPKTVLVVEDNKDLSKPLSLKLAAEGFKVITAEDGEKGLKAALENKPDMILLDIIMPNMDGITMLKNLRQDEWGKNAQVIILTNLEEDIDKMAEAMEVGVTEYLIKANVTAEGISQKVKGKLGIQ